MKCSWLPVGFVLLSGCLFGGPALPTLEMQNPPKGGAVDIQVLDSSVEPGVIYLKLLVRNASARPLVVDRRTFVLTDGRAEWRAVVTSKPLVTVKPNGGSAKLKLTFAGAPAELPAYDLMFKKGAFRQDNESGPEVALAAVRLLAKKPAVATPEPTANPKPAPTQPR